MRNKLILLISLLLVTILYSQTKSQKNKIVQNYDLDKLKTMSKKYYLKQTKERNKAIQLAKVNNWKIRYQEKGISYELKRISNEGKPLYYKTYNRNAAISTRANQLHNGGNLGLNLEGQGMDIYVWDSGIARSTHQEYDGTGGSNRFSPGGDNASLTSHAAHVMGTIISSGFQNSAKGMAPQANGIGFDWNSDLSEVIDQTINGMLISNHSYGDQEENIPDWTFGAYTFEARSWDNVMFNAPYYLMVMAAGNAGNDNSSNGLPLNGNSAYDKLSGHSTSKNGLVVANAQDANIASNGTLNSVSINSGSSEGPTDDYRIKPDITGNGTLLFSTLESSNNAYASFTGTSMASPNVAGSMLLLQQHYNNINSNFMKAATLKGLALHTADDAGSNGPDAKFGWGLMNTMFAAETISNNGLESIIIESSLNEGEIYTLTVISDDINPLLASISWTDPISNANSGIPNDPTPVLINDLDIRVSNGTDFKPWKLTSITTNAKDDNNVDPYERVDVTNANGMYTITITHKGNLTNSHQNFSLIVTGLASPFTFSTDNAVLEQCADSDAIFNFNFDTLSGTTNNTTFTAQNIPSGALVSFSPNPINTDGNVTMTISNLLNVTPGEYLIDVMAQNSIDSETKQVKLTVYNPTINSPTLISPLNNANTSYSTDLSWSSDFNAQSYEIQIAEDSSFNNIIQTGNSNISNFSIFNLNNDTTYYWRVKPNNLCGSGLFSNVFQFKTTACTTYRYSGNTLNIPDAGTDSLVTTFNVNNTFNIEDINVFIDVTHNDIGSLLISLKSPNDTSIFLQTPTLECDATNILVNYDEDGTPVFCDENAPIGYFGNIQPSESLDNFIGESTIGVWTLDIRDLAPNITGTLNDWSINFCDESTTSINDFGFDKFNLWPNPTNGKINISFNTLIDNENIIIKLYDITGKLIDTKTYKSESSGFNEVINYNKYSKGLYLIQIRSGNISKLKKIILN